MKMIGMKRIWTKEEEFKIWSFSVTVERQTNGIRLRIRNLTTEDQGMINRNNK